MATLLSVVRRRRPEPALPNHTLLSRTQFSRTLLDHAVLDHAVPNPTRSPTHVPTPVSAPLMSVPLRSTRPLAAAPPVKPEPLSTRSTGGALTGPAKPPEAQVEPSTALQSAAARAVVRDLRRTGEVLRNSCTPSRQSALRAHLGFLLDELHPDVPGVRRLRTAVGTWTGEHGQPALLHAVGELEQRLGPEPRCSGTGDPVHPPIGSPVVRSSDRHPTITRTWWLLDGLEPPELDGVETLVTTRRWRVAKVLGRRAHRRRHAVLWG